MEDYIKILRKYKGFEKVKLIRYSSSYKENYNKYDYPDITLFLFKV